MQKIKNVGSLLSVILLIFTYGIKNANAATTVNSTVISGNQIWQDSDYIISGEVRIDKGNSLQISANSNVTILPSAKFSVYGGQLDFLGNNTFIKSNSDSTYPNVTTMQVTDGILNISGRNITSNRQFINSYGSSTIKIDHSNISGVNSNAIFANVFHNARFSIIDTSINSVKFADFISAFDGVLIDVNNVTASGFEGEALLKVFGNSSQPKSFLNISNSKFTGAGDFSAINVDPNSYNAYKNLAIMLFSNAELSVNDSIFSGLTTAINLFSNAIANVAGSEFKDNYKPIYLNRSLFGIKNSSILSSTNMAIEASGGTTTASENWWGTTEGPVYIGSTTDSLLGLILDPSRPKVSDGVQFNPWLLESPRKSESVCCSSIFFIPGIKGSRLYQQGSLSENQLWVPNRENDVDLLKMDANGNSTGSNIYTRDVVDSVVDLFGEKYDLKPYADFIDQMKSWQMAGDINEYFNFAYDWRLRPEDVIQNGTLYDGGIKVNPVGEILRMAKSSKNGKVAIITHSNGGLLSKYIVQKLVDLGHADVIEKVINVAMPEFGAPQAIASLLHGEGESIAGGVILSDTVARDFAKNIPTVYNLAPSEKYFTQPDINKNIIQFSGISEIVDKWRNKFGDTISSYAGLTNFLLANKLGSVKNPDIQTSSIDVPAMVNGTLTQYAQGAHAILDQFTFPTNIPWFSIQAVGRATLSGLRYFDNEKCPSGSPATCNKIPDREAVLSTNGDGVVIASKGQNDVNIPNLTRINIELDKSNQQSGLNLAHGEIMRDKAVENTIGQIVYGTFNSGDAGQFTKVVSSPGLVQSQTPTVFKKLRKLTVFSPVTLNVTDKNGKVSGVTRDFNTGRMSVRQEIPNSTYIDVGESKSVIVPAESEFRVKIEGYDSGTFSFEDKILSSSVDEFATKDQSRIYFKDIPTTDLTVADYTAVAIPVQVQGIDNGDASSTSVQVFTGELKIDAEGDGIVDLNLQQVSTTTKNSDVYIATTTDRDMILSMIVKIREKVSSSSVSDLVKRRILEKLVVIEKKVNSKNSKDSTFDLMELINQYGEYSNSPDMKKLRIKNRRDPVLRLYSGLYFYASRINKIIDRSWY